MTDKPKPITINATAYWASLQSINQMSGGYQIDMGNLSDAAVEALEARGITVKTKEATEDMDMGRFITCKSKNPMKAYNTDGDEIGALIGNGSKIKAAIGFYDWTSPAGKKGRSPSAMKIVVTDLEVYEAVEDIDVDMEAAL